MRFTTAGHLDAIEALLSKPLTEVQRPEELTFSAHGAKRRRKAVPVLASVSLTSTRAHGSRNLLASLTGLALLFSDRDAGLRRTFKSIDVDGKGHITERDLEAFAARSGLPSNYVAHFVSAVRANHSGAGAAGSAGSADGGAAGQAAALQQGQQQQQQRDQQQGQGQGRRREDASEDAELTFGMFRRFVRSREEALRRAFSLFDQDGDGRISLADLDASLSRVAVCCPRTRCIYRCRDTMAAHLHAKAAPERGSLGFSEFRDFFLLLPQQDMLVEYWLAAGAVPEISDKLSIGRAGNEAAAAAGAKGSPWGHLIAGAIAGATSRTATAPLETLRLAAMAGQLQSRSLAQAASDIVSSQGWAGLYRGNLLNVMRSAPQKALDFFAFDAFKRLLGDDTAAQTFLAAGLAGCTSWVALYPLEVVRSRITVAATAAAASSAGRGALSAAAAAAGGGGAVAMAPPAAAGPGLFAALSGMVRAEGPGALYRGLGPSVAAIFPEAAITYGLHDALKKAYTRVAHEEPGVAPSLAFGVLSAFCGQLVSFPLETVSRRLQVAAAGPGSSGLRGMVTVVRGLLAEGGPAALYRGIGAATLRLIPMACVSFGTYEVVRAAIVAWEQQREERQVRQLLTSRCVPLVLEGPGGDKEVVGRICTPPGGQGPTLCGAVNGGRPCRGPSAVGAAALLEPVPMPLPPPAEAGAAPEGPAAGAAGSASSALAAEGTCSSSGCNAAAAVAATSVCCTARIGGASACSGAG